MKESKIGVVAAPVSIALGIVGIVTMHFGIGIIFAIMGMMAGYASLGYTSDKLSYAGVILNNIAFVWLAIICVIGGGI